MRTKSSGTCEEGCKTMVTGDRGSDTKHDINEGCGREPMYSRREAYMGVRNSYPADHEYADMYTVKSK